VSLTSADDNAEIALQLVLSTVLDAVVVTDGLGIVVGWNEVAERTFGWTADEAISRSLSDLIVPQHHRQAHCAG
jgi:two-component system sensor histidine kinase UhpB